MRITITLIGLNVFIFILQAAIFGFTDFFALTPSEALSGAYWQFLSYMFLHGGPMHLTLNMFILFLFGEIVEHALGKVRFIVLYLISGIGSAVVFIILEGAGDVAMLGASGAVFGILAAYGLMFPKEKIWVPIPFGIPLPAYTVVILLAIMEFVLGFFSIEEGIANFGHFGGIITGVALTMFWKRYSRPKTLEDKRNHEFFWE
jgi:membrane associated rhomboid family serine protease